MTKKKHRQSTVVLWTGEIIQVDSHLTALITVMNVPGLATWNSCQDCGDGHGYVQFSGPLAEKFMEHLLYNFLHGTIYLLDGLKFERSHNNENWPGSVCVRWNTFDYKPFLSLVRKTMSGKALETFPESRPDV